MIPTLKSVTKNKFTGGGIFSLLKITHPDLPWSVPEALLLDTDYYGNKSGDRLVSPLVVNLVGEHEDKALSTDDMITLANLIYLKYHTAWEHFFAINELKYNPIHNYDMVEMQNESGSVTGSRQTEESHTDNEEIVVGDTTRVTGNVNGEVNTESSQNTNGNSSVYGFNSNVADPTDTSNGEGQSSGNTTENRTTTENTVRDNTTSKEGNRTTNQSDSTNENSSKSTTLNRSGNIGVTSSQDLIEQEKEAWLWSVYDYIYKQINEVLALAVYCQRCYC